MLLNGPLVQDSWASLASRRWVSRVLEANKAVLKNDALAANYIAEARFLRAVCYHSMLQLYARPYADGNGSKPGLPLRLRAETKDGNNDLERSTVAQVYDQILADLDFAVGVESLEVRLFDWEEIPWNELAFPSVRWALHHHRDARDETVPMPRGNPRGETGGPPPR